MDGRRNLALTVRPTIRRLLKRDGSEKVGTDIHARVPHSQNHFFRIDHPFRPWSPDGMFQGCRV